MSQVLIGIIGVILFIGLALAGALFLGPRFQESTHTTKAAAIVQRLEQVSAAARMYRVSERKQATNVYNLVPEYIKELPANPVTGGAAMQMLDRFDSAGSYSEFGGDGLFETIRMSLGSGAEADAVCAAINLQVRGTKNLQKRTEPFGAVGCFYTGSAVGSTRYAYAKYY